MTNAIYLATTEPYSGKSVIALGLMNLLFGKTESVAYFKPVISSIGPGKEQRLELLRAHFNLPMPYEEMFIFTRNQLVQKINSGNEADFIDTIIDRFKKLQGRHDFVVVEGTDFISSNINMEFDGNITIAKNLGVPVAIITRGDGKSVQEIVDVAVATVHSFLDEGVHILTVIANKLNPDKMDEVRDESVAQRYHRDVYTDSYRS